MLEVIYVTRHGFRSNWDVNSATGIYTTSIPSPTGIPSDPALASHGVLQSQQLAAHLRTLSPPIERLYSSPFYRCLETLTPFVTLHPAALPIRLEPGLGEWYGTARFDHPSPAPAKRLRELFDGIDPEYEGVIRPSVSGESIRDLHDRTAYAVARIVEQCDRAGVRAVCLCTHAATLIAVGRVLTGRMPGNVEEEDFRPFTCGLSRFVRRKGEGAGEAVERLEVWTGGRIPEVGWREGKGVGGGWDCELNGDCSFLSGGEERGWRFSGDESFFDPQASAVTSKRSGFDAGADLGVTIEGKKRGERTSSDGASRL